MNKECKREPNSKNEVITTYVRENTALSITDKGRPQPPKVLTSTSVSKVKVSEWMAIDHMSDAIH